ncbi:hypothetical protein A3765_10400 [Oleiphilus sp. HI0130]|nr:hypothetical protein A3758_03205 [Oleiphilus sp. HI0118]KZZ75607.1 hypothetical protein A3765_10400 [Oleiphilus sp. HI0130]
MSLTIADALGYSADLVSETPDVDVRELLCAVLEVDSTYLRTWPERMLSDAQAHRFYQLIEQRKLGTPVAHLVGSRGFWSLDLEVSPDTLIPRPDTECLVEFILNSFDRNPIRMLDLGTGTGAIALAVAVERPLWEVVATDVSENIVELAKRNAQKHDVHNVHFSVGSWFSALQKPSSNNSSQRFGLIVSNPPYIDAQDHHLDQGDVRFEPKSALVAEDHGFADLVHIANEARAYLASGGTLCLEHGFEQGERLRELLDGLGYEQLQTHKDYGGNDRFTSACFLGSKYQNEQ